MQNGEGELQLLTLGGDGDLGYNDTGHGETIVLVHAGVFSGWFRPLSRQLPRDRFRVVRTRRSGYRGSAPPRRHLGLADHARHAARLLDGLGIGAAHWVGHSSSRLIGLLLAQDRPDLVASLSLLEPAPGGDLHGPADEQFVVTTVRPAMEEFFAGDPAGAFDRFMRGIGGDRYPAVVTSRLGPGGLDAARAQSAICASPWPPPPYECLLPVAADAPGSRMPLGQALAGVVLLMPGGPSASYARGMSPSGGQVNRALVEARELRTVIPFTSRRAGTYVCPADPAQDALPQSLAGSAGKH